MPLTKASLPTPSSTHMGEFADAEAEDGTQVLVSASYEAIADYG